MQDLEFRQLVERIKLRSPIEGIVGERVSDLKKKGALYWARCPFHEERTPSFAVNPQKATWHCYGACGDGGDVIRFIERFDGLSFLDALRLLAQAAGEELPEGLFRRRSRAENAQLEDAYDVLRRAGRLYRRHLAGAEGTAARSYLAERGLGPETCETFGLGWSPREGNPVLRAAGDAGVAANLLAETGLVRRSEDGRAYDFFRGRLMVPIRDRLGRTVGFGARILPGGDTGRPQPKYVNTPETPLFHKGRLIYGLDLAADAVRKSRHLVLVEGYTDVMAAHQVGHRNVAAVLGTSTTEDHAALVRRSGAQRVTLLFDGDDAGRQATRRALAGLLPLGLELHTATLAAGVDPCDLLLGPSGAEAFAALLDEAPDWFTAVLRDLEGLDGAALGRSVDELFELVARLSRPVERAARLRELSASLSLPEDDVRSQWREFEARRRRPVASPEAPGGVPDEARRSGEEVDGPAEQAFELLLGALLLDNSLIPLYAELGERCPAGDLRTIFDAVLHLYEHGSDDEPIHAGTLLTELSDDPARERVVHLEERARTAESPQALARDQELWLERRRHDRELTRLRSELTQTVQSFAGDDAAKEVLQSLHAKLREGRVPRPEPSQPANP